MANPVSMFESVLIEDAIIVVLPPILIVHGIFTYELQLPETVVPVIRSRSTVDDKLLPGFKISQLLRAFIGAQPVVLHPAIWCSLPRLSRNTQDLPLGDIALDRPRVAHLRDAKIGGPALVSGVPAAVHVVQARGMLKVGAIDCKLVVCIQLGLHGVVACPGVGGAALQNIHAVVYRWAIEVAEHVLMATSARLPSGIHRLSLARCVPSRVAGYHSSGLR